MTPLPTVSAPLRVPERSPWILPGIMLGIGLAALILAEAVPAWSRLSYFVPFTFLGNSLAPLPYDGAVVYLGANHPLWVIVPIAVAGTLLIEVGRLRRRLQLREELDESLILLVSDHGASRVHTHLDLADWFRAQGVPTLSHPIVWERQPRAAVMVAGNGSAMVYARPGVPRTDRWPMERLRTAVAFGSGTDLIATLVREPSVAFVAAESESGGIWLESEQGSERLSSRNGNVAYQPVSGDPLRLGGPWGASARDWLQATGTARFRMRLFI